MATEEWTEFTLPTIKLVQDTITEPTEEYDLADLVVTPDTVTMGISVVNPIYLIRYSNPSSLAGLLTVNQPTLSSAVTATPDTVTMSLTVNAPNIRIRRTMGPVALNITANDSPANPTATPATVTMLGTVYTGLTPIYSLPASVAAGITVNAPTVIVTKFPSEVAMTITAEDSIPEPTGTPADVGLTLGVYAPIPNAVTTATVINMFLTVNQPTVIVSKRPLNITMNFAYPVPNTDMALTIVRYIKDPIKTGGCAQCGTFLYESVRGRQVRGEVVKRGRNFDQDKGRREDRYIRCGRCGWINHLDRAVHVQPDSSRMSWGLKYTEIEAGESDISYP